MTDRVPIPAIAGLLTGFVAVDVPIAYFAAAQTLESFYPVMSDPPSGGSVSIDVRTATGGGGSGLSATIASGARAPATATTGAIAIAAGTTLYLRVTAESGGALGLSGWVGVSAAAGVTAALTTRQRVKDFLGITGSGSDSMIDTIVAGVSQRMQSHMGRQIVQVVATAEKHDGRGRDNLLLDHFPVVVPPAVVVRDRYGDVVDATEYQVDQAPGILVKVEEGTASVWEHGRRNLEVDYTHGYATVPEDLALAATIQAAYLVKQTSSAGDGRLGDRGSILDEGGTATYLTGEWAPGVLGAMEPYRDLRRAA